MAWGCIIGGAMTVLGGGRVPLAVEMLEKSTAGAETIGILQYTHLSFPLVLTLFAGGWVALKFLFPPDIQDIEPAKKALSIALGVFVGISPFWGFHTLIVLFMAIVLKLNKAIAFAFSNVSLPPFIPFIVYISYKIGQFFIGNDYDYSMEEFSENFEIYKNLETYIIGSLLFATSMSIILGSLSFIIFSFKTKKTINNG